MWDQRAEQAKIKLSDDQEKDLLLRLMEGALLRSPHGEHPALMLPSPCLLCKLPQTAPPVPLPPATLSWPLLCCIHLRLAWGTILQCPLPKAPVPQCVM